MKIHLYKTAIILLLVFINIASVAQEKKNKPTGEPNYEKDVPIKKQKADSFERKTHLFNRDVQLRKHRFDSLHKDTRVKKDRPDSLYKHTRIIKFRADSLHKEKRSTTIKHKRNAADIRKPAIRSQKIATTIECGSNATVFLQNIMHKVNIVTTSSNKVTLVTTVHYQGRSSSLTDIEWFSKLKLSMAEKENNIEVISGDYAKDIGGGNIQLEGDRWVDTIFNGAIVFDSLGNAIGGRSNLDRNIILYVPTGVKVDIESKYADITFENNMRKVKVRINNGDLTLMDAEQLYANIYTRRIKHAEVNVTNGKLTAKNIDTLNITSKNSSIVLDKVDRLDIRNSQADHFDIKEAQTITGKKAYGGLRLTALTGSVDISGVNADVRIKTIKPSTSSIKIDTKYADLFLPVNHLKHYTVDFKGNAGNLYTPFEKMYATNASFKAFVGNSKYKPTIFQLNCQNCSVNF